MRALAGAELGQEQLWDVACPFTEPRSCSFGWYKAPLPLSHMYTGKEGSRCHFSFVCSRILMQILCYLLKEASENREGNVRPRTAPVMLEPTWMENCQMYKPKVKSNWSTLSLYQASWRNSSKNFTFQKDLCFNRHLQCPTNLQHIFTVSSWTFKYLFYPLFSFFFFSE